MEGSLRPIDHLHNWLATNPGEKRPDGTWEPCLRVHPPRRSCWRQEVLDGEPLSAPDMAGLLYQDERTIRNWATSTIRHSQDEGDVCGGGWHRHLPLLHMPTGVPVTLPDGSHVAILEQGAKGRGRSWRFAPAEPREASRHYIWPDFIAR